MTTEELIGKVKDIKKKRGLTQGRLAKLLDVDPKYIASIEDGHTRGVPVNILSKIEDTIDYLEDV
ncbi:MAG: helix-turn-helix transcriptional regulator [Pseudomonadota bacterium]